MSTSSNTCYVTDGTIACGNSKTARKHQLVTAAGMGLTDEQFKGLLKPNKKGISPITKGTPPLTAKAQAAKEKEASDKAARELAIKEASKGPVVLREDRILEAIKGMFKEDGTRISQDDFTADNKPSCPRLDIVVLEPGEKPVTGPERDAAWERYENEKKTTTDEQ